MKKDKETATILTFVPATGAAAEPKGAEDEFARGKDIDQIFDELEETYGRLDKAPSKAKRGHPTNASRIATTPAKIDPVTEKRAKAYRDMEPTFAIWHGRQSWPCSLLMTSRFSCSRSNNSKPWSNGSGNGTTRRNSRF
jgi:hypothetical protein